MRAAGVVIAIAVAAALGWLLFQSLLFTALGALLLFSASAEFLLPIHYRLTTRAAYASYGMARLCIEWERVRRVEISADSGLVRLSPFPAPCRLDGLRGVVVRPGADDASGCRADVLRAIAERRGAAATRRGSCP